MAAAGNYGNSTPTYPAAYPEVVSVAGTDPNDALYSWSDFGSWVKLAAPGCNYTTGRAGWFGSFCGTSSATPAVAGIAALAFSYAASATNLTVEDGGSDQDDRTVLDVAAHWMEIRSGREDILHKEI